MAKGKKGKSKVTVSMMDTSEHPETTNVTINEGNLVTQVGNSAELVTGYENPTTSTAGQHQGQSPATPGFGFTSATPQDATALQQAAAMILASAAQMQNWPSSTIKVTGPKYDGIPEHFNTYMEQLETHLIDKKLWWVITEENPDPVKNKELYHELTKCLDHSNIELISNLARYNGKHAFRVLREHHEGDRRARKRHAMRQLHHLKMGNDETPQKFLGRVDVIRKVLSALNTFKDDEMYIICVIDAIPDKHERIRIHLTGDDTIETYEQLRFKFISQMSRQSTTNPTGNTPTPAIMMGTATPASNNTRGNRGGRNNRGRNFNNRGNGGGSRGPPSNKSRCTKCFSEGHLAPKCTSKTWCKFCVIHGHHTNNCYKRGGNNFTGSRGGSNRRRGGGGGRGNGGFAARGGHYGNGSSRPDNNTVHHHAPSGASVYNLQHGNHTSSVPDNQYA